MSVMKRIDEREVEIEEKWKCGNVGKWKSGNERRR